VRPGVRMHGDSAVWSRRMRVRELCGPLIEKATQIRADDPIQASTPPELDENPVVLDRKDPLYASDHAIACTKWTIRPISILCYANLLNSLIVLG
jgi:hypothetical protein